jgi:branched-chain amino acid transport system ATP-binding protein
MSTAAQNALEVRALNRSFGALRVTCDVDLILRRGARAALIGPNGAGKTTLINLVSGALRPSSGRITLLGKDVTGLGQADRARLGLLRSFQITRLFKPMTIGDNVRLAILQSSGRRLNMWRSTRCEPNLDEHVFSALETVGLQDRESASVTTLAYGEQRLLELALALSTKPSVLLLDEPAAGVPQSESNVIVQAVQRLPADLAVLLIEHDMDLVFRLAEEITVLVAGAVLMKGTPKEVETDERVQRLYLGDKHVTH